MNKELIENERLRLLVLNSCSDLGDKIDRHLVEEYGYDSSKYTFKLNVKESWFSDGCEKVEILDSVRNTSTFICTDVYNSSITYKMRTMLQHTSPNDLMQQLRDTVAACNCHCSDISILMPMLFAGRQHRRKGREALTCADWLHEFDRNVKIKKIITCDAHDPGVEQALGSTEFENIFLTNVILEQFINDVDIDEIKNIIFIAPDNGAIGRTNVYLNSFYHPDVMRYLGTFYKERDYNILVNGKNPVIDHRYIGSDNIAGMTGCLVDDMIASGGSILDVIDSLNNKGVYNIYMFCTFALFTEGVEKFDEYFKMGKFKGIYTTNASYINSEYFDREWLHIVDCSKYLSDFIKYIYEGKSITNLLTDKSGPGKVLKRKFDSYNK